MTWLEYNYAGASTFVPPIANQIDQIILFYSLENEAPNIVPKITQKSEGYNSTWNLRWNIDMYFVRTVDINEHASLFE